uniref:Uncharacterized protein n=1 Tax=Triticum urartu TaxID=4572 RepID=A0A8R7UKS9_TRIUA
MSMSIVASTSNSPSAEASDVSDESALSDSDDDCAGALDGASSAAVLVTRPLAASHRWNVGEVGERGRHGEQPRRVREVEAPGGAAAECEHGGVVRAGGGLGRQVRPEPEPRTTLARDAHLAHPPPRVATALHAAVHRVPRLPELGAPRGALGRRRPPRRVLGRG